MARRLIVSVVAALATAALAAPPAPAASAGPAVPLAGTGTNIEPIARVPIGHPTEVELAGDWAFVADDGSATEDDTGGLVIVNIADPAHPFLQGKWVCDAGWGDIDLSADANIAILTNAHAGECLGASEDEDKTWVAILDISDKAHPKLLARIPDDDQIEYVHTSTLDNKLLYLNPQAWAGYPQGSNPHIPIYDISDPSHPVRKAFVESEGVGLAHDTYIDHRPDGKSLLYAASIHTSDVFDVTDPFAATMIQRTSSPEITISHDVQPSWDRKLLIVDDEGAAGGQVDESVSACGKVGTGDGPTNFDSGSIHFYEAAPDGTFANDGRVELGSFNAPANVNTGACVAHIFWQAPNENRLTQAYYRTGAFVVDFADPASPKMLGDFHAEGGGNYWSNKPHNGFMYASNQDTDGKGPGSLDILRYTGEGGTRWPATAGPAEVQRAARQGVPYVPLAGSGAQRPAGEEAVLPAAPVRSRSVGRIRFSARLARVPGQSGKRVPVTLVFRNANGKRVGSVQVRRAAGKRAVVRIFGGAVSGRYTWIARAGGRTIGRGTLAVGKDRMTIAPHLTLSVGAR
jgi:hypothetical protein